MGDNGADIIIQAPLGVSVLTDGGALLGDLVRDEDSVLVARGGPGGSRHTDYCGLRGQRRSIKLDLKLIADVGFVGFPNAGKSTLLKAISRASPKIASYPFTTLNPHLGIVFYSDLSQLAVADLPGIIPGAHRNHGLGIDFLRHIQRCSVLVYVLDLAQDSPLRQLEQLQYELEMYQPGLSSRPAAVLANKIDLEDGGEKLEELRRELREPGLEIIPVSGRTGINLANMLVRIKTLHEQFSSKD